MLPTPVPEILLPAITPTVAPTAAQTIAPTITPVVYGMFNDPLTLWLTGLGLVILLLILGYFPFKEFYRKVWHFLGDVYDVLHHLAFFCIALLATTAGFICLKGLQPEITESVRINFPAVYGWIAGHGYDVLAGFFFFIAFEYSVKWIRHLILKKREGRHPGDKKKSVEDILASANIRVDLEEIERRHQEDSKKKDDAIEELKKIYIKQNEALRRLGTRKAGTPELPEEKEEQRAYVGDPSIPLTEEEMKSILPLEALTEKQIPPEELLENVLGDALQIEEEPETKKKTSKRKWYRIKDWDYMIWGENVHEKK